MTKSLPAEQKKGLDEQFDEYIKCEIEQNEEQKEHERILVPDFCEKRKRLN